MLVPQLLRQLASLLFFGAVLTACKVGPNFHSPAPPETNGYTESPLPEKTVATKNGRPSGKAQAFVIGKNITAEWWTLFHSPDLDKLICLGIANSPNVKAAKAALRVAQENMRAEIGSKLFPQVNGQFSGTRERFSSAQAAASGAGGGTSSSSSSQNIFDIYNASVNVTYALDVFGGARRSIEALGAQVDFENFELEAAYLSLTSNIVTTAISAASFEGQIQATKEIIRSQENQLTIVNRQFNVGGVSRSDVLSQESQLATSRATLPPLEQSLAQSRHALAALVGAFPAECSMPNFRLEQLDLPAELPVSLPSDLVRQRPDIRASEALVHAASANIGVATANLLPQFSITGSYGWEGLHFRELIRPQNLAWSYGASVLQPIFAGGSLFAKRRAAIAAFDQTYAQYQQTVLLALQNVADTLRALEHDAKTLRAQTQAETAARDSLRLIEKQFHLGGVSYLSLLTAERQYQTARISRLQAEATRYADTAALFQALGGGWWNRSLPPTK